MISMYLLYHIFLSFLSPWNFLNQKDKKRYTVTIKKNKDDKDFTKSIQ